MSIFRTETLPCPGCGRNVEFEVCQSVNADRRPDLRQAIIERRFQSETCADCATTFRRPPDLTYMNVGRKQWIIAAPARVVSQWPAMERQTAATFARSYGPAADPMAQEMARGLAVRVVFGWGAFREKLVAQEAGLDDATLELLKLSIIRNDADLLDDRTELRLIEATPDTLSLARVVRETDALDELLSVPRGAYDAIAQAPKPWAELRAELTAGPFVDLARLLVEPVPA